MTEGDPINNYVTTISPYKVYMAKAGDVITIKGTYTYVDDANNSIPVTGIDKTAFKAYYEINGVKVYPSDVDSVTPDENDKNVVIVKFLAPFQKGETYFVQYDNAEEPVGSFVAINPKKDSVKSIVITTNKVVAGDLTEIKYQQGKERVGKTRDRTDQGGTNRGRTEWRQTRIR